MTLDKKANIFSKLLKVTQKLPTVMRRCAPLVKEARETATAFAKKTVSEEYLYSTAPINP